MCFAMCVTNSLSQLYRAVSFKFQISPAASSQQISNACANHLKADHRGSMVRGNGGGGGGVQVASSLCVCLHEYCINLSFLPPARGI